MLSFQAQGPLLRCNKFVPLFLVASFGGGEAACVVSVCAGGDVGLHPPSHFFISILLNKYFFIETQINVSCADCYVHSPVGNPNINRKRRAKLSN